MSLPVRITLLALTSFALACGGPRRTVDEDSDCRPACTDATCGQADGCGGACAGACGGDLVCSAARTCVEPQPQCVPSCVGALCGAADGCGGTCSGLCEGNLVCGAAKTCVESQCVPDCASAACGAADGCGGTCIGFCDLGSVCDAAAKACRAPKACPLPSSLGALGKLEGESQGDEVGIELFAELDVDHVYADLELTLWDGYGVFGSGVKTGTFSLTGDETNADTCGACVEIYGSEGGVARTRYWPTGGSLTLTSVVGRLKGSLSNVSFVQVKPNHETGSVEPLPGGCTTQITSASFDAEILPSEG